MVPVAGDLIQIGLGHQRGLGQQIAPLLLLVLHPALQGLDDPGTLGQQDGQALTDYVHSGEEFQFPAQLVVVPLQGLLLLFQVLVQLVLAGEGNAIDSLEHFPVGIATPVSAAGLGQFKAVVLDPAGVIQMRTGAQVGEVPLGVERDNGILRQIVDQLYLVRLVLFLHIGNGLGTGLLAALLADLLHLRLDLLQVLGGEGEGSVKVVVPAFVDGGADGERYLRPQTLDGLGHDVGAGMPVGLAVLGVFKGVQIFFGHGFCLLFDWGEV